MSNLKSRRPWSSSDVREMTAAKYRQEDVVGEILGIGMTHYPGLTRSDDTTRQWYKRVLNAPKMVAKWKDPANFPAEMKAEIGNDDGLTAIIAYRARMVENFRKIRKALDEFAPDFVLIVADDQYENFQEDIIPTFCVYGLDDEFQQNIWQYGFDGKKTKLENYWNDPEDYVFKLRGHREAAKFLTSGFIRRGVPMPYAYKLLHHPILAHSFNYTALYLDWDRKGFPYPVIPFHVNCYGSSVIKAKGLISHLYEDAVDDGLLPDPPGPTPALCMDVGATMAQILNDSPYRVAIIGSSSWSHSFLAPAMEYAIPDHAMDRKLFAALKAGDYETWRRYPLEQMERSGQHEMLNWCVLAGAMAELGRKPIIQDWIETHIFLSNKCFALFPPG